MVKVVSAVDFFAFLDSQSNLHDIQSITSRSEISSSYQTTYFYINEKSSAIPLCYQDFDVTSNFVKFSLEVK